MKNSTEIVQEAYSCFGNGDIPGLLGLLSEDIDWRVPEIENASFAGARRGQDSVGEFFVQLSTDEDITQFEPREFIAQNDKVAVLGHSVARVRATNRTYETDWVHIFTVKDGKITAFVEFFDNAAATRAYQKATAV